jgi:hypothetical protein
MSPRKRTTIAEKLPVPLEEIAARSRECLIDNQANPWDESERS